MKVQAIAVKRRENAVNSCLPFLSPALTHQILRTLPYDRLMAERSRHGVEHEAEIEVESIPYVILAVDSDREAENLEIVEGNADEAPLKLDFRNDVV